MTESSIAMPKGETGTRPPKFPVSVNGVNSFSSSKSSLEMKRNK